MGNTIWRIAKIGGLGGVLIAVAGAQAARAQPAAPDQPPTTAPVAKPARSPAKASTPKTFTPETTPKWIVAATTPAAAMPEPKAPAKNWRPQKRWALAPVIGTDGVGADLSLLATSSLVIRARGAWLGVGRGLTYDQVRYDGRLKFTTGGLFADLHPLPGGAHPLFISAGVVKGRRNAAISATPQASITYNGHTYSAAQIGTVSGAIRLPDSAPFLGVGWDNTFDTDGAFGFRLLAGVVASGRPSVALTSTGGLLSASPLLKADLDAEEAKIKAAADYLRYYPVVSTGISYKF